MTSTQLGDEVYQLYHGSGMIWGKECQGASRRAFEKSMRKLVAPFFSHLKQAPPIAGIKTPRLSRQVAWGNVGKRSMSHQPVFLTGVRHILNCCIGPISISPWTCQTRFEESSRIWHGQRVWYPKIPWFLGGHSVAIHYITTTWGRHPLETKGGNGNTSFRAGELGFSQL